ncbi:C4-dicarboxylate TRAP transporter substrate-binding protein [Salipiger mucosus]|uniref:TRAP dicarboxylate transporter-DctP subunit n=1 Tax=Salipiger mucosus DSM 16094 TaxID=1123237 RepID=S9RW71_9RHOB|nr:C4-dicarboxylate TRAP transporter substrate-binding protein [Salipiger mucosus]EPX82275.1 TRAP dicarboxylate transporter- DctP subunit [Salipiger mucosus DSM 16094]
MSQTTVQSQNVQQWADEINEKSGGNISIEIFWSESMGKATEMLSLLSSGAVDLGSLSPAYFPSQMPLTGVTQLPNVYPDVAAVSRVAHALDATPEVQAENAQNNLVPMFWTSLPVYHIVCSKKIASMSDFPGTRIRAYGEYVPQMWSSLGATGVVTTATEQYEGIQRGAVDCAYAADDFSLNYNLYEVADYYVDAGFGAITNYPTYMNAAKWESLDENVQNLFREASENAIARDVAEVESFAADARDEMLSKGLELVEFTEPDALQEATPDFLELWATQMEERGAGTEAEAVMQVVRDNLSASN